MGIGRRILRKCMVRREIFAHERFHSRRIERTGGKARIRIRVAVDGERRNFQQADVGRVLELGPAANDNLCADSDLRRVPDVAGGGLRRKNSRESFGGLLSAERLDGSVFGVYHSAHVFFVAPVARAEFGGARRNGFNRAGRLDCGSRRRNFNLYPTDEEQASVTLDPAVAQA